MGPAPRRLGLVSCVLGTLTAVASFSARAESAARKPTVISGSAALAGGVYTASASGAVVELPSLTRFRLAPNARVRVYTAPQLLALTPGPRTWTWSLALQSGRVDVELPPTGRNAVLASLGKLNAIITAGRAVLRMEGEEGTTANAEGEVRTLLNGRWQTIPVGWMATLTREDPNATAKPSLAPPALTGTQRIWFAPSESVALRGFRWARVAGAERYELRLRRLSDGQLVVQRGTTHQEWSEDLSTVEPGRYTVALRSVDARGIEGSWGPASEVRVIGVVLPPGAYSTEKAIYIGAGQQVQFTDTVGLEMTYLGAGRYFPAAQGAGLYRGQTTVVGLRMPGALDTAVARLEPRGLYADVRIGPQRAVWPRDPISIDIQLKSTTGSEIPAFVQVVPSVTLGLEPMDLNFVQNGNTLHGVLAPSDKPGPWIVRVDVADQFGVPLGHDFLEIAAQPAKKLPAEHGPKVSIAPVVPQSASEPPIARKD